MNINYKFLIIFGPKFDNILMNKHNWLIKKLLQFN